MVRLLILDKDGTLTRPKSGQTFVQHPKDQELIPGVAEALQRYRNGGWVMAIASNQGGVAAGHKTLEEAIEEMKFAMELTGINTAFFCPDMTGDRCLWLDREKSGDQIEYRELGDSNAIDGLNCRKPAPGMLIVARSFQIWWEEDLIEINGVQTWKPDRCLMVGDRPEDQGAAQAAGINFMWAEDWIKAVPNG